VQALQVAAEQPIETDLCFSQNATAWVVLMRLYISLAMSAGCKFLS
jgi:hypothetical protein